MFPITLYNLQIYAEYVGHPIAVGLSTEPCPLQILHSIMVITYQSQPSS